MRVLAWAGLLALTALLPACRPDAAKTTATANPAINAPTLADSLINAAEAPPASRPASPAEARARLATLRDSATAAFQRLQASDDRKLAVLRLALQELSKRPGAPRAQLAVLRREAGQLPARRYDRQTMAAPGRIDAYDAAQDSVLHRFYPLAAPGGQAPTPALRQQVAAIKSADEQVLPLRIGYDRAAKIHNAYLAEQRAALGGQPAELPLFEVK